MACFQEKARRLFITDATLNTSEQNQKKLTASYSRLLFANENPSGEAVTAEKNVAAVNKASDSVCATFCTSLKSSSIFGSPS